MHLYCQEESYIIYVFYRLLEAFIYYKSFFAITVS